MGRLSFFTAVYVGGGAIASTVDGEDTSSLIMARPQQQRRQQQRRRRPNVQSAGSKYLSFTYVVALLLLTVFAAAQDGDCNCSPVRYTFELQLDAISCPDPPALSPEDKLAYFGPGVNDYTCNPDSGLPVEITFAQFIPIFPNGTQIAGSIQTRQDLELTDGDTLDFISPNSLPPLVGRVQLNLRGDDQNGVELANTWTIDFTNECGILTLQEGTGLGWVVFKNLVRPSKEICPRDDPPPGSYSYAFSKAGKGSNKAGKNVNSKYDGYSYGGKSGKGSKSSKGSRRILRTATSANEEHVSLPPMTTLKDESVGKEGKNHNGLPPRRRRLHV
ncbi:hypothetical protein ACHAWT_009591 [Skeletonema menzelii]